MNLDQLIDRCRNELCAGLTHVQFSGINWLNKVCGELSKLCRYLHEFLLLKIGDNSNTIETCFLCMSQIIVCIKYMEKALGIERRDKIVLTPTRQFFLDRMLLCLSRLKTINEESSVIIAESNFVHLMDVALDLIAPLSLFASNAEMSNIAGQHAEASIEGSKIRSTVELILGHVLSFVNVAPKEDKKPLTAMCQKVLRDGIAFEESCSLAINNPDDQNRRLKAATLENAFYQLDKWMNDSLLRLVFEVFVELEMDPVQKLRDLCENECEDKISRQIERIDETFEKILQIGNFAMSFAWNNKIKSKLRSSLASLESLDSILIPSILSKSRVHSELLQEHWSDEMSVLTTSVQNIIDTQAFCGSMIEILYNSIRSLSCSYDKGIIENLILYCDVLDQHFRINSSELELETESSRKFYFDDYVLMLKECKAALSLCNIDESHRVIKRFKILLSILKKFYGTLKVSKGQQHNHDEALAFGEVSTPSSMIANKANLAKSESMAPLISDSVDNAETFFKRMGISASPMRNVLYESKREKTIGNRQGSLRWDDANSLNKTGTQQNESLILFKRVKKRSSLRVALFKRFKENKKQFEETYNNDTLGLHITDILDQITDLSSTLSNP